IQTLIGRGYNSTEALNDYLFSTFEKDVANPSLLKDADKAVERILKAIKTKEKILICGDYDVDGITSSAMMMICLKPLGANVNFFLPNRVKDGYGLSVKTVERAHKNNYKVLITVDNGTTAFQAAEVAKKLNIDLIITDHHKPHEHLPDAYAIINPHQNECSYPFKSFAGVGVTFKILSLLYKYLNLELPEKVYELLLLGTVADVVPLTGENRFWVRHGLKLINSNLSLPIRLLKENAKLSKDTISSNDIGFFLAPQINALGRLDDARQGVRFLLESDQQETREVAVILNQFNQARKEIERKTLEDVTTLVDNKKIDLDRERIILACSKNWQPGVIGLVASRIVGLYNRPALLFHLTSDNIAKGSCRSISEFNIFDALTKNKDLLISFGGHKAAAGLALESNNLSKLKDNLEKEIKEQLPDLDPKPLLKLDAEILITEANKKFLHDLKYIEPFGNENNQPLFYLKDVSIMSEPKLLKDAHVKCLVFSQGIIKSVIFFNRPEIYDILLEKKSKDLTISIAVYVTENHFNNQVSIEFQGIDITI
ncbi:MAG: single-stranded-DNA-specific exonuclease RecJ, partial [Novosphingobium sp.]|nr:single-stranded-DNA-specific exonuclease RecJ [Novosphingobium sp.]